MTDLTLFISLDVHKKTISVAMAEATAGAEVRFYGTIANTPDTIRGLCKKLTKDGQQLHFCYEAGPCGYGVQRQLTRAWASLRCSGAGGDPAQGRRQGEDGPAGRDDAGPDVARGPTAGCLRLAAPAIHCFAFSSKAHLCHRRRSHLPVMLALAAARS